MGLLSLVVLSAAAAGAFIWSVRSDETQLNDHAVPYATAVAAASLQAKGVANDQRGFLISGDRSFVAELNARVASARQSFDDAATTAIGLGQRQAVTEARVGFERWLRSVREEVATFRSGNRDLAISDAMGSNRDLRKAYEASLVTATNLADDAVKSDTEAVEGVSSRSVAILSGVLLAALVVGCVISFWLFRSIVRPIYALLTLLSRTAPA